MDRGIAYTLPSTEVPQYFHIYDRWGQPHITNTTEPTKIGFRPSSGALSASNPGLNGEPCDPLLQEPYGEPSTR